MAEFEDIRYEERDGIARITIDRPKVYNAFRARTCEELIEAMKRAGWNRDIGVIVLGGAGDKAFCTGNDLKYHAELRARTGERPVHPPKGYAGLTARHDLDKPVIAAVNGIAMGGGFEIALACDLIIASDQAVFALPEPRVGLAAGAGGFQRLPRTVPLKQAMGMLLTGRRVGAEEGFRLGFVTAVVPHVQLMAEARRWAGLILECSPMSVRATKQAVLRSLDAPSLEVAMNNMAYPAYAAMARGEDAIECPRAFAEKRKPVWKGR